MSGFLHLHTAAALLRVPYAELESLLERGELKAEPSVHGGKVIAEAAVMDYLAQKGTKHGG